jgi:mRNA interferase YafQ
LRKPFSGTQFQRDVKLAQKRGKEMGKLREIILLLVEGRPLPARCKDHPLGVDWKYFRDCHIEPDWLLIYKIDGEDPLDQTDCPAAMPDAHAHWKLKPPRCPVTSTTSPMKYRPGALRHSMVFDESSAVSTPPAVTSAFA